MFQYFITQCKDHPSNIEAVVMMKMYQEKYPGLCYSEDQEYVLRQYVYLPKTVAPFVPSPYAAPFVPRLMIHREQHERQHGNKKEHRLNDHSCHGKGSIGQKSNTGSKEALKDSRRFRVCK